MNRFLALFACLLIGIRGVCTPLSNTQSSASTPIPFDSIPNWIARHVNFPEDAYNFGRCGIERLTISATWDGRVFISEALNALHPAYEQEIIRVVAKAPRCVTECRREDVSRTVEIDFSKYLPKQKHLKMVFIGRYQPPKFKLYSSLMDCRGDFVHWLDMAYKIPQEWSGRTYADTVTITYRIERSGKVAEVSVSDCRDAAVRAEIERTLKKAPLWCKPGISGQKKPIDVVVREQVILGFDAQGKKTLTMMYQSDVFRNSSLPPADPKMIVLMPEVKPRYKGGGDFHNALKRLLPEAAAPIEIEGSFIIEKDGTTSGVNDDGIDDEVIKTLLQFIRASKWQPARQGGELVRTLYTYTIFKFAVYPRASQINVSPKQSQTPHSGVSPSVFGKRYLDLNPKKTIYTPKPDNQDRQRRIEENATNSLMYNNSR